MPLGPVSAACASLLLSCLCVGVKGLRDDLPPTSTVCKTFPGLTKGQLELCHKYPDVTAAAFHGLQMAVEECQYQFRWHRWNCSSLNTKNRNPHSSSILQKGYRESAFSYAISAAGVAHSVARACGQGTLLTCGCEPRSFSKTRGNSKNRWKWGGCSHNLDFGIQFSTMFLDSRERGRGDIQSRINLHNNEAGRLAVANRMQTRCKCHGMSGSCELKTCWKSAPDFRVVGSLLKDRFRTAIMVDQSNMGNGSPLVIHRRRRTRYRKRKRQKKRRRDLSTELLYYQKSPNFCESNAAEDVDGTVGRQCNRTSRGVDSCSSLCCGRGYNIIKQRRTDRCHCRFHWCCYVVCQNCTVEEWITVCK
ncbi:protein Wnt-10a isoform X2 [Homalodisca vitripennis]|uniref:protein Wnt-10a isoform X2 n=1 Tax=Homalodisca vitripennis TaxID=197043 RepID=UPI001EE9E8CB|nr:protein Wnt-10a isoform X2 [Homalodisca vitripennis]